MTHELTDAELLTRFRAGHDAALGRLFERYESPVFRFLIGVLKDHHQAEDALQETFVQALRKADAIDPATFRGWLYTVAYQQGMLQKRRARRLPAPSEPGVLVEVAAGAAGRAAGGDPAAGVRRAAVPRGGRAGRVPAEHGAGPDARRDQEAPGLVGGPQCVTACYKPTTCR